MSSNSGYEKSVKGGTKSKLAAPKSKYVQHLLDATRSGEAAIGEVFRALQLRLKEPTWTIVFKSLVLTHMLIRDGHKDSVMDYLANSHQFRITSLTSTGCSPMSEQGANINDYGAYLTARIKAFASVKTDYVKTKSDRAGQGRLRKLSVDKGLLRETESVQKLIGPLIKCKFLENEVDNDITLTAFRLLVADLLILFQVANEGVINVLEHYFEMSKPDATRALAIYKTFVDQTDGVIVFMSLARSLESVTRLEIPDLQHAPTSLGNSLEEYVNDPDFEQNRIQYLAKKTNGGGSGGAVSENRSNGNNSAPSQSNTALKSALKKPEDTNPFGTSSAPQLPAQMISSGNADLIDFFGTIDTQRQGEIPQPQYNQNPMQNGPYSTPQMTGQNRMSMNPYMNQQQQQVQAQMMGTQSTGNPYQQFQPVQQPIMQQPLQQYMPQQTQQVTGNYSYQNQAPSNQLTGYDSGIPQPTTTSTTQFQTGALEAQPTGSNPFRRSMMPIANGVPTQDPMSSQRTGGNPFSRGGPSTVPLFSPQTQNNSPYINQPLQQQQQMQPQTTGNPFAKNRIVSDPLSGTVQGQTMPMQMNMTGNLMPQQTGTSNPFRKSMMPIGSMQQSFGGR